MSGTIGVYGGDFKFHEFLNECVKHGKSLKIFSSLHEIADMADKEKFDVLLLLPEYEKGFNSIPETDYETLDKYAKLKRKGQKLYIENYDSGNLTHASVFGIIRDSNKRYFFDESIVALDFLAEKLGGNTILQARSSYFYPGRYNPEHIEHGTNHELLSVTRCLGTHRPVGKDTSYSFSVLVKTAEYYCASFNMSQFDGNTMLPYFRWKKVFSILFSQILDIPEEIIEEAFEKTWQKIGTTNNIGKAAFTDAGNCGEKRRAALESAIEKAVSWHFNSGIIENASGKNGCFEMIRSNDLSIRANKRVDASLYTGLLLLKAGKYFHNAGWMATGRNIIDYTLNQGAQLSEGPNRGLFKWFMDHDVGPKTIYSSDCGRDGLVMIEMYEITGEKEFLQRAINLGNAYIRWFGERELLPMADFNYGNTSIDRLEAKDYNSPEFYDATVVFLSKLYRHTTDERYRNIIRKCADRLVSDYPAYSVHAHTMNFSFSRLMMILCTAQEVTGGDYSGIINILLDFFIRLQHPAGGVFDEKYVGVDKLLGSVEFAVGMGEGHDKIVDMEYCVNTLLGVFSVIQRMENSRSINVCMAQKMFSKLMDFTLNIQISSADNRLDGGWMRAFDIENCEYYGLNKDRDWGAYCIMGGWVMSAIPLVMLDCLGEGSIFIGWRWVILKFQ